MLDRLLVPLLGQAQEALLRQVRRQVRIAGLAQQIRLQLPRMPEKQCLEILLRQRRIHPRPFRRTAAYFL
ncbi:hypothetical protein [Pseudomonas aeruginosa]|uniref:hypothetical protein n=1 Tax=Pseudomonas aeruginosa TaxID=287 RepID=UPI001F3DF195|nr:hypothetical protein [Pseudomonas aeruginosa]